MTIKPFFLLSSILVITAMLTSSSSSAETKEEKPVYEISFAPEGAIKTGQSGVCKMKIKSIGDWKLKTTTPFKANLKASPKLDMPKKDYSAKDFSDKSENPRILTIGFTSKKAGTHNIEGTLSFFLCTNEVCKRFKANSTCTIDAK